MSILKLIASDNYIPVNRELIKMVGLAEAVILGELCTQYNYWEKENRLVDDMFYCSSTKLEERTGLSEYQQRKAIQSLREAGIIDIKLKGLPATKYFKINTDKILIIFQTSSEETKELVPKKLRLSNTINNKTNNNKQTISKDIVCKESQNSEIDNIKDLYNEHCFNLPKILKLTDKRIKAIKNIIKKYSVEEIIQAFDLANSSDFLIGNNDRGWKADMDFILREDKFVNILEGKYGGKKKINHVSSDMGRTVTRMTAEQKKQLREDIANGKAERI